MCAIPQLFYLAKRDFNAAIADANAAIRLDPQCEDAFFSRSQRIFRKGRLRSRSCRCQRGDSLDSGPELRRTSIDSWSTTPKETIGPQSLTRREPSSSIRNVPRHTRTVPGASAVLGNIDGAIGDYVRCRARSEPAGLGSDSRALCYAKGQSKRPSEIIPRPSA